MVIESGLLARLSPLVDASRDQGAPLGVLMVGLQGLRELRIRSGYGAAGELVERAGALLREALRPGDEVVELGRGDFAVLLPNLRDGQHALLAASRLLRQFEQPVVAGGQPVLASVAVGIAMCPEHADQPERLCRQAEQAMLMARHEPDRMRLCGDCPAAPGIDPADLLEAIRAGQLEMHLQPVLDIRRKAIIGAEALARWSHPVRGPVSPAVFVPVAENSGMISQFTRWAINASLQHAAEARAQGLALTISMNLSATAFAERGLVEQILGALRLWDAAPKDLVVEVTETAIVADLQRGAVQLKRLNAEGIRVSIDDFGVGNASVAYLKQFPATEMKIDQSFVTHMLGDLRSMQLVKAMIGFAHTMGMRVVAEGVEDTDTLQALADLNCNLAQGYGIGRPQPAAEFIAEFARKR